MQPIVTPKKTSNATTRPMPAVPSAQFATRIDLPSSTRKPMQATLNACLCDALDLHSQTKQAHWNVKGPNFYQLHLLFDDLAGKIEGHVDLFAERVTALGGTALGTVRMAAAASELPEFPTTLATDREFIEALVERYAIYGSRLCTSIEEANELQDPATGDVLTEALRAVDLALYLLEAHLQQRQSR